MRGEQEDGLRAGEQLRSQLTGRGSFIMCFTEDTKQLCSEEGNQAHRPDLGASGIDS